MSADRFTRLPRSAYPVTVVAAIAICEQTFYPLAARLNAFEHLRAYNPDNIPLRPAIQAELAAGLDRVE